MIQIVRDKHFASQGCIASMLRQCFKFNVAHQKNTHMIKAVIPHQVGLRCILLTYMCQFLFCGTCIPKQELNQ